MQSAEKSERSDDGKRLDCVSCSCCCPFRHATRDEKTGSISIKCGNPARSGLGEPAYGS